MRKAEMLIRLLPKGRDNVAPSNPWYDQHEPALVPLICLTVTDRRLQMCYEICLTDERRAPYSSNNGFIL